jgi:hypothetical protein
MKELKKFVSELRILQGKMNNSQLCYIQFIRKSQFVNAED